MKSTIFSMLIVLGVMSAIPMLFIGDNKLAGIFGLGSGSAKPEVKLPSNVKTVVTDKKVEVYKWRDKHGVMQFSNTPPRDGGDSDKVVLSPNTNVIEAIDVPEPEPVVASGPKVYSLKNPYTPDGMKELVNSSKDIQETMNQRQAEQEKMMDDLFKKK